VHCTAMHCTALHCTALHKPRQLFTTSLLQALAFIHAEGIIHLDIKPENVMFSRFLRPHYITSLYHLLTISPPHYITISLYHYITSSLYHYITISLYHYIPISLYHGYTQRLQQLLRGAQTD
jgi:serine/threonine protein kinase